MAENTNPYIMYTDALVDLDWLRHVWNSNAFYVWPVATHRQHTWIKSLFYLIIESGKDQQQVL